MYNRVLQMSGLGYIQNNIVLFAVHTLWSNGENFPIDCSLCIFIIDIWLFFRLFVQNALTERNMICSLEILLLLLQCVQPSLYKILDFLCLIQMQQHLQKWNSTSMKHYYYFFFLSFYILSSCVDLFIGFFFYLLQFNEILLVE